MPTTYQHRTFTMFLHNWVYNLLHSQDAINSDTVKYSIFGSYCSSHQMPTTYQNRTLTMFLHNWSTIYCKMLNNHTYIFLPKAQAPFFYLHHFKGHKRPLFPVPCPPRGWNYRDILWGLYPVIPACSVMPDSHAYIMLTTGYHAESCWVSCHEAPPCCGAPPLYNTAYRD